MQSTFGRSPHPFKSGLVNKGRLVVAVILLFGLIVLGYGYFQHIKIAFYVGLAVTLAGVLNGVIQIVARSNR